MSKKPKLLIGTDPEFMLVNGDNQFVSAIGVVKGTKENKVDLGGGSKMFYDNVLVECNVRPGQSAEDLVENIQYTLRAMAKAVYPLRLRQQASATYPKDQCQHPDAKAFGCEPEYCAYTLTQVLPPSCPEGNTFRSAGGHVHLGTEPNSSYPLSAPIGEDGDRTDRDWGRVWVVRMLDLFLGIPSLWMDKDETSPARRKLYGKAGTHRPAKDPENDYGVEYRATSNFWLAAPKMVELVYNISAFVVDFVAQKRHLELWKNEEECNYNVAELQDAINNSNKTKASEFLNGLVKKMMPASLYTAVLVATETQPGSFNTCWSL